MGNTRASKRPGKALKCSACHRRPRHGTWTVCRDCRAERISAGQSLQWFHRKGLRQAAREGQGAASAPTRSPTPAEMRQLMDACDAAADRALALAQSLAGPKSK